MATFGKDSTLGVAVASTWGTAIAVAANTGVLTATVDPVILKGDVNFDDASGFARPTDYELILDNPDQNIVIPMRWNGVLEWIALTHWMGDDTQTGGVFPFIHTLNYQQVVALGKYMTLAWRLDSSSANSIGEATTFIPQQIELSPDAGFWNMTISTLGHTIAQAGDGNIVNDGTSIGNVTYITTAERMRFKANTLRKNLQGGAGLVAGDAIKDVSNVVITLDRPYDSMDDVLAGTAYRQRAEPIQSDHSIITLAYDQKTYDYTTHRSDLDKATEYKADLINTQTISSNAHSLTIEWPRLVSVDPQVALERGVRIPMSHSYRGAKPASAPTGMTVANEIHIVLNNNSGAIDYEINA